MALIVEDGTGLATAESYISVAGATAYHAARGNTAWDALASDTVREQNLRKATDFMIERYRGAWKGSRYSTTQALDWPRTGAVVDEVTLDSDEVPTLVANACAELALRAVSATLLPDMARGVVRSKVGPLETEYDKSSPQGTRYAAVDAMLASFLRSPAGALRVVRA